MRRERKAGCSPSEAILKYQEVLEVSLMTSVSYHSNPNAEVAKVLKIDTPYTLS
jgi:hypothetical protein